MKKISLEDFMKIVEADETLHARVRECRDAQAALKTVMSMAEEMDYELYSAPSPMETLADDDLSAVMGGVNMFAPRGEGELNPYSWFVTIVRRLLDIGGSGIQPLEPDRNSPESHGR